MSKTIFESIYPLTIVADRYGGVYSRGAFTAWNLDTDEVPTEIASDDVTCMNFWGKNKITCGKGATVEEAVGNLYIALHKQNHINP